MYEYLQSNPLENSVEYWTNAISQDMRYFFKFGKTLIEESKPTAIQTIFSWSLYKEKIEEIFQKEDRDIRNIH